MPDISKRLQKARTEKNMSLAELSDKTGIAKSTLQRYETGATKKIPLAAMHSVERALRLPSGYLLGLSSEQNSPERMKTPTIAQDVAVFPVMGDIAAGYDRVAVEDWAGETVEIPTSYLSGRKRDEFIVLRVRGDSMYPLYQDGDKVLILKQATLNHSGDIGAVIYNDDLVTIKKVEYAPGEDWLRLVPINPEYKPQYIEGEELTHCSVIGIPRLLIREL